MSTKSTLILANFGGPRSLSEIEPFLIELLTDQDVIRTPLPRFFERWFFKRVAIKRAGKISHDYAYIGGKSPIFEDTQALADKIQEHTKRPVITFHRYLPETHSSFLHQIEMLGDNPITILPLYPQFSYATTGSVARFFSEHLPSSVTQQMQWIPSYAAHSSYVEAMQNCIRDFLQRHQLKEEKTFLFFSAHGLPQSFVDQGDPYQAECYSSYEAIRKAFPQALSLLAFQSKFGPGEWLRPYTSELSENPNTWNQGRENIVFVPLSFTTDHLETLFEIEETYLPNIRKKRLNAYRCPALNRRSDWVQALIALLQSSTRSSNDALIRR